MVEERKGQRRKEDRRKPLPAAYAGVEHRSSRDRRDGKDRRKGAAKARQRYAAAQAKSLIYLVVILAALWGGIRYWTSSPAHVRTSEEMTKSFRYSGVAFVVVEGRGVRVYLKPEYESTFDKGAAETSPLLRDIAEEYAALTGKESVTLYIYIKGKLARKVKL